MSILIILDYQKKFQINYIKREELIMIGYLTVSNQTISEDIGYTEAKVRAVMSYFTPSTGNINSPLRAISAITQDLTSTYMNPSELFVHATNQRIDDLIDNSFMIDFSGSISPLKTEHIKVKINSVKEGEINILKTKFYMK